MSLHRTGMTLGPIVGNNDVRDDGLAKPHPHPTARCGYPRWRARWSITAWTRSRTTKTHSTAVMQLSAHIAEITVLILPFPIDPAAPCRTIDWSAGDYA
jgi:hypothetical protein